MSKITCEMALSGLTTVLKILDLWGCNQAQKCAVLNIDIAEFSSHHAPHFESNLLLRMSHVLSIHSALRTIFSERKNTYGFMTMVNNNGPFFSNTPLGIICTGSLDDLEQVANHMLLLSEGTY